MRQLPRQACVADLNRPYQQWPMAKRMPMPSSKFRVDAMNGVRAIVSTMDELSSPFVLLVGPVPPNPLELMRRQTFALLQEMPTKRDDLLVDAPATEHGSDTRVPVAARCRAALALVRGLRSCHPLRRL